MPKRYSSKSTAHSRLQNWQQKRVWQKILSMSPEERKKLRINKSTLEYLKKKTLHQRIK
ncbi:MAG: hypothetical protein COW26_07135 [Nitrosopumilales archaeon CG15_BIG_FIL_POST_REV_8_21_14_020_33_23]|nr:MAG: hypothetical protein COW26_07135 [Nitrosopumilales archaeon CG15_BIG_FIL_POST_REV_8_21_14_020_33_23]